MSDIINEEECFKWYEYVRLSGITNMYDYSNVKQCINHFTEIKYSMKTHCYIMREYIKLCEKYPHIRSLPVPE